MGLLHELPRNLGSDLLAPYELWLATFAPDEGSYPKGPRILLFLNDHSIATASVRGTVMELQRTDTNMNRCGDGEPFVLRFESVDVFIETNLTTQPGEEACWVAGTITVRVSGETQVYRAKGVSGI